MCVWVCIYIVGIFQEHVVMEIGIEVCIDFFFCTHERYVDAYENVYN